MGRVTSDLNLTQGPSPITLVSSQIQIALLPDLASSSFIVIDKIIVRGTKGSGFEMNAKWS